MNHIIKTFPYPGEKLSEHPSINYILKNYFPTLKNKVTEVLKYKTKHIENEFSVKELPQNNFENKISVDKFFLKKALNQLSEILGGKKPIVFISDSCFTNNLLLSELETILEKDFNDFVEIVNISYSDDSQNTHIEDYLYENSIVILGGSYSDLEDVPESLFEGKLASFIKDIHNNKINSKLIGVCWGQQLISSIIGFDEIFSEKITSTYRGVAQFGIMPGELTTEINQAPYIYRNTLNSITDNGKNKSISTVMTRTGHVDFNLLDSYTLKSSSTLTFMKDSITGSPLIWGTKNGNIIGNQAHFEINPIRDSTILQNELEIIIPLLQKTYGNEIEKILNNFNGGNKYTHLAQPFYTSSLLAFADSIIKKNEHSKSNTNNTHHYSINNLSPKSTDELISNFNFGKTVSKKDLIKKIEEEGFLKMSTLFDWKVNRGINEASNILGLNLPNLINEHKNGNNPNYTLRDWGAGNGKLINDIKKQLGIITYGISDFAYFDIYESLIHLEKFSDIPRNILKIFVQELITNYKEIKEGNVKDKIIQSLEKVEVNSNSFKIASMFTDKTYRFNDKEQELGNKDKQFIKEKKERINELKEYIGKNLYEIIIGYYDSLLFSDFNSLYIPESSIKKIDFQIAIRSTCHVDSKDLKKILEDYVKISAKPGAIYIDNGVVRSDSGVPRINEYIELEKNNKNIKVYFTYDQKTSYITSAIILNVPFVNKDIIEHNLNEGHKLLTTTEINKCSFFKVERFFRELMILTFKNLQYSHDKNKEIINFLIDISSSMDSLSPEQLKKIIINKLNTLINEINSEYNEFYSEITEKDFDFFLSKVDNNIREFFINGKVESPKWFNPIFERKN